MFCIENKVKIGSAWASFRFNGETSLLRCCSPPCSSYKLFSTISARPLRRSIPMVLAWCALMQKRWKLEMRLLFSSRIAFCWSGERQTKFDFLFYEIVLYFQWDGAMLLLTCLKQPSRLLRHLAEMLKTSTQCCYANIYSGSLTRFILLILSILRVIGGDFVVTLKVYRRRFDGINESECVQGNSISRYNASLMCGLLMQWEGGKLKLKLGCCLPSQRSVILNLADCLPIVDGEMLSSFL